MTKRTIEQQINEANDRLARLKSRQKKAEARRHIVLGAALLTGVFCVNGSEANHSGPQFMTKIPDDITQFIAKLQAKLADLPEPERQQMMQIIRDLIRLAKSDDDGGSSNNGSDQIH